MPLNIVTWAANLIANKSCQWKSMLTHQGWFNLLIYATLTRTTNNRVCNLHIYLYPTPLRHNINSELPGKFYQEKIPLASKIVSRTWKLRFTSKRISRYGSGLVCDGDSQTAQSEFEDLTCFSLYSCNIQIQITVSYALFIYSYE